MSLSTFKHAIALANEYGSYITIGGGEPTVHPKFEYILAYSIAFLDETPYIITNGKITKLALLIAKLIRQKKLGGQLSQDQFHDNIDDNVIEAFGGNIRNTTEYKPGLAVGRAIDIYGDSDGIQKDCPCDSIFVKPNGKVYMCGCENSECIGDVINGITYPEEDGCSNGFR